MSGIIDDIIFQTLENIQSTLNRDVESAHIYEAFNKLKVNQKYQIVKNSSKMYETKSTYDTQEKSFLFDLQLNKETFNTKFTAVQTKQLLNYRIASKQHDLLTMKQYLKRHKEFPSEATVYINNGRTYLVMNNFLSVNKYLKPARIIDVYNAFIGRNLFNFQQFVKKYIENKERTENEQAKIALFHKDLQIARILSTTSSTTNIDINKSQFKFINSNFEKRNQELGFINQNIEQQQFLQKSAEGLYLVVPGEVCTSWITENFIPYFEENQKKFNTILNIANNNQKTLEDFVFNMAKIETIERLGGGKPFNQGGFTHIFAARVHITYVSSADMTQLPQNTARGEKFIAMKKLKQTQLKRARNKVQHQKQIVMKMRGSTSQFLPKYYGTQSVGQFQNTLIMDLLQGEELCDYVQQRSQTLTLWSKIYLLLNVIHGIRHLVNYKITHLDLKPSNVIVLRNLVTKLIDFGEAHHSQICPKNYMPGITLPYSAPEVVTRNVKQVYNMPDESTWQFSQKQDSYAFGVMIHELIFGTTIFTFSLNKIRGVYYKRQHLQRFFLAAERVQDYGDDMIMSHLLHMILRCMDLDPAKRPCFQWIGICLKLILNSYSNS